MIPLNGNNPEVVRRRSSLNAHFVLHVTRLTVSLPGDNELSVSGIRLERVQMADQADADLGSRTPSENLKPLVDIDSSGDRPFIMLEAGPCLIGGRCGSCGSMAFPMRQTCMECGAREMGETALPSRGVLYSSTTIHVSSARPTPYSVGYVDLENGVRLFAGLRGDPALLQPDSTVKLSISNDEWYFVPNSGPQHD